MPVLIHHFSDLPSFRVYFFFIYKIPDSILTYMKWISEFNESSEFYPTVGEVYNFFYGIIEDFCDHKNEDFKFQIHCNDCHQIRENEVIKWVSFYIESRTKFTSEDIYPVVKILFDWSKEKSFGYRTR